MRILLLAFCTAIILVACDENRIYEKNVDFQQRFWAAQDTVVFEFEVADNNVNYNLYTDIRNSVSYPWSRIFFNYSLLDSNGTVLQKDMKENLLFDPKTGKPAGTSGLGDIYDHRVKVISNFKFPGPGKYKMKFDQAMRADSLQGILAVGLRVEKVGPAN
jgi:gliding motility-associated lipoprotein GldH